MKWTCFEHEPVVVLLPELLLEAVELVEERVLVVAAVDDEPLWEGDAHGEGEEDALHRVRAFVHDVAVDEVEVRCRWKT